jgi:hypothetical protein
VRGAGDSGPVITDYGRSVLADQDDDEAFEVAHRGCRFRIFGWHRVSGGPPHCGACCPPPPFSPQVLDTLARMRTPSNVRCTCSSHLQPAGTRNADTTPREVTVRCAPTATAVLILVHVHVAARPGRTGKAELAQCGPPGDLLVAIESRQAAGAAIRDVD